jgi:hypothetical protein
MKVLIAVDGSAYTKRMLAYLATHDEWFGAKHSYTVVHSVLAVPHRAAAFVGQQQVREFYEADAELVFGPIRAFFAKARAGLKTRFSIRCDSIVFSMPERVAKALRLQRPNRQRAFP